MTYYKACPKLSVPIDTNDSETIVPRCNEVYREGREAYKKGVRREDNPYISCFMQEVTYTWTSEDCWNMGWDLELEIKCEQNRKDSNGTSTRG